MDTDKREDPTLNPEISASPILLLMRRMERFEVLIERMIFKGALTADDLAYAELKSSLNHAERIIRVREKTQKSADEVKQAASVIAMELDVLRARIEAQV